MPGPDERTGFEPALGSGDSSSISGDEPSLPADFVVLKALLADDISAIPAYGGLSRIERMQAIRQRGKTALPALLELFSHKDPHVQETAITVVGWVGDPETIPALVGVLCRPTAGARHLDVRRSAAIALRNIGIASEQALLACLGHADVRVRGYATEALAFMRSREAAPRLTRMLAEETEDRILYIITRALRRIGDPAVLPLLEAAVIQKPGSPNLRMFEVIAAMGGSEAADSLLRIHASAGREARTICMKYLIGMQDPRVFDLMETWLTSADYLQRSGAITLLAAFNNPFVIPQIERLLNDEDSRVRQTAARAIEQLQRTRQS